MDKTWGVMISHPTLTKADTYIELSPDFARLILSRNSTALLTLQRDVIMTNTVNAHQALYDAWASSFDEQFEHDVTHGILRNIPEVS